MGNIVWLASYPKSGNTWLRAFLHNLMTDAEQPVDINKMAALTQGDSQAQWYAEFDDRPPPALSAEDLARLRPKVHAHIAESSANSVFVKTHNALVEVAGSAMISRSVTAGVIYVVRNPLDVALSYADHLGVQVDDALDLMATSGFETPPSETHVPEHHSDWSSHVKSWTRTAHPALHVVRYEDMASRPAVAFAAIAGFIGINPARETLLRAVRFSSFKVLRAQEKKRVSSSARRCRNLSSAPANPVPGASIYRRRRCVACSTFTASRCNGLTMCRRDIKRQRECS